jgi:hypothetical protein
MRKVLAILLMLVSSVSYSTDIVIVDYMLDYEHHYSRCNINLHADQNVNKYLYMTCGSYAAPPRDYLRGDWTSVRYDEIGVNGVYWHRCKLVGEPTLQIRFECNVPLVLREVNRNIFTNSVQPVLMSEVVVYDPFR